MKDKLIITCDCGCSDGFEFSLFDDEIYVTSISSDFYSYQRTLFEKIDKKYKEYFLARNKKVNVIKEAITTKNDIEKLLEFLNKHLDKLVDEEDSYSNYASIYITKDTLEDIPDYISYAIELRVKNKSFKDIFFTKTHRKMDLVIQRKDAKRIIKLCEKVLKEK